MYIYIYVIAKKVCLLSTFQFRYDILNLYQKPIEEGSRSAEGLILLFLFFGEL